MSSDGCLGCVKMEVTTATLMDGRVVCATCPDVLGELGEKITPNYFGYQQAASRKNSDTINANTGAGFRRVTPFRCKGDTLFFQNSFTLSEI